MSPQHQARKRFGQHFLIDPSIINQIVAAIAPRQADTLVEIGPGKGAITIPLSRYPATLHTIEFDRDLVPLLRERFANDEHVRVHEADALQAFLATQHLGKKQVVCAVFSHLHDDFSIVAAAGHPALHGPLGRKSGSRCLTPIGMIAKIAQVLG